MKRVLLIYLTTLLATASAFAVPAKQGIMTRTQSDGSVISYEVIGDEFSHYTLVDGIYTVLEDNDGDFCYATIKDNHLASSGVKVRSLSRLSADEKSIAQQSIGLRPMGFNPIFNRAMHSPKNALANRAQSVPNNAPANEKALQIADWGGDVLGERNLLVILVDYPDVPFSIEQPREKFHKLLNEENYSANGSNGSTRDYFIDASNGKFTPNFDVVGPYRLPNNRKHYGGNNTRGDDGRPAQQTVDACDLAEADGVDFSKYDGDGDGKIDLVFIVYAGYNEAEGGPEESVWPHQWEIYPGQNVMNSSYPTYDGKQLVSYACSSELMNYSGVEMCNIGTFCHEFGHALGLPDWYDTDNGAGFGLSFASIMNSGNYLNNSRTPPTYNIIERWMLGWAFPKEMTDTGAYEISHISNDDAYIIWANDNQTECFLFESRVKAANYKWDEYLHAGDKRLGYQGGEGMLVYHLDWDSDVYNRWQKHSINTDPGHQCAQLFRASPTAGADASKSWFFPGARKVTSLSYDGVPSFQNWDEEKLPFYLDNISIVGDKIHFYAMVKELVYNARQYDILVDWMAAKSEYSEWDVECTDITTQEVVFQKSVSTKYVNITPLQPGTHYLVKIYGKGTNVVVYELELTTQDAAMIPMSSLNIASTYRSSDYIRLSVKNLDCVADDIVWYIDGKQTNETYLKLAAGKHQVCAVVTDPEGNVQYLYRTITIL